MCQDKHICCRGHLVLPLRSKYHFPFSTHAKKLQRASGLEACPWGRQHTKNCLPMFGPSFFTVRSTQGSPWALQLGGGGGPRSTDFQNTDDAPFLAAAVPAVGLGFTFFVSALVSVVSCGEPLPTCPASSPARDAMENSSSVVVAFLGQFSDVFASSILSVCPGVSAEGMTFVSFGLKKERRLPFEFGDTFATLAFFPLGAKETDVEGRLFTETLGSTTGFKFSLFSSSSWDPGNTPPRSGRAGLCSTLTRKRESFCCLPTNSGR